jgi:cation transport regulator ChaB
LITHLIAEATIEGRAAAKEDDEKREDDREETRAEDVAGEESEKLETTLESDAN